MLRLHNIDFEPLHSVNYETSSSRARQSSGNLPGVPTPVVPKGGKYRASRPNGADKQRIDETEPDAETVFEAK